MTQPSTVSPTSCGNRERMVLVSIGLIGDIGRRVSETAKQSSAVPLITLTLDSASPAAIGGAAMSKGKLPRGRYLNLAAFRERPSGNNAASRSHKTMNTHMTTTEQSTTSDELDRMSDAIEQTVS